MNRVSFVRISLVISGAAAFFTLFLLFGYRFLKEQFGVPQDVLETAGQVTIEIKQKHNGQMNMENAARIPESIIKLWMRRGEEGRLDAFVLEVFQIREEHMLLLTIPGTTRVTMSNELYQEMQAEVPLLPQLLTFQTVSDYFPAGKAEKLAARLAEELLDLHLDSYAVLTDEWMNWFLSPAGNGEEAVYGLSDLMLEQLAAPVNMRGLKAQIEQMYADPGCYISKEMETMLPYLEAYEMLEIADISAGLLPGEHTNAAYLPSVIEAKQLIYEYQRTGKERK